MRFKRAFRLLTFVTALWAFVALVSTGQIHLPAVLAFVFFYVVAVFKDRIKFELPGFVWTAVNLIVFGTALWAWFTLGERMYAATYFFFYLEINKLLTAKTNRDYLQIYGLTFFHMLAASVSTDSVVFAPMLVVYTFMIIAAMMVFTIKRDAEATFAPVKVKKNAKAPQDALALPYRVVSGDVRALKGVADLPFLDRRTALWLGFLTMAVVAVGSVIFWVVPRAAKTNFIPLLGSAEGAPRKSGFADNIAFGGVGEIQSDPSIVMRAILDPAYLSRRPDFLRVRGTSLDEYTGREWRRSGGVRGRGYQDHTRNVEVMPQAEFAERTEGRVKFRMVLEPESSSYFFLPNQPALVEFESAQRVEVDQMGGSIRSLQPRMMTSSYDVTAIVEGPLDRQAASAVGRAIETDPSTIPATLFEASAARLGAIPAELGGIAQRTWARGAEAAFEQNYLQRPLHPDMEVIEAVAREWTAGKTDSLEIASEVERRFHRDFAYTTKNEFSNREDHLSYFLRTAKSGHCEYFATGMALMLRSLGIPARVVNGYLTDEWSDQGTRFIIRQEHAHSWVEARVGEAGRWTTFDPTPAGGVGANRNPPSAYRAFSRFMDNIKTWWYQSVVDYSLQDQEKGIRAFINKLRQGHRFTTEGVSDVRDWWGGRKGESRVSGRRILGGVLIVLAIGVCAFLVYQFRRYTRPPTEKVERRGVPRTSREDLQRYLGLLDEVQKVYPRRPSQTILLYARDVVEKSNGALADLVPLTEVYYRARYQGQRWPATLEERVSAARRMLDENRPSRSRVAKPHIDPPAERA